MVSNWEQQYKTLVNEILTRGSERMTRNAVTKSIFGAHIHIEMSEGFPILTGRKMFPRGVLGELAAMLRQPKHIDDFEKWGCNYWKQWANADGSINVDYGNAWFNFNGVDQIAQIKEKLANNPYDRRLLISGWRPDRLDELSLPCCHYAYQLYVADGKLSMMWMQRSVDVMVGLPSDIVFAAAWLLAICNEFDFVPGHIVMSLGDCHLYESHWPAAQEYVERIRANWNVLRPATWEWVGKPGKDFCEFDPSDLVINNYHPLGKLELELYA